MSRFFKTALFVSLFISQAFAQFTTVTGTVIDPHSVPYALGTITPTLVIPSGAGSPTLNGQQYIPPSQAVGLDKNGSFSFNVADNTVLLPAGTKWNFAVCSATGTVQPAIGTGPQCFSLASPITISGSTQSISTQLNAVALALTVPIGGGGSPPASPIASIQTNLNGTIFGSVSSVANGSQLVSQGTSLPPIYQTKPLYDVRDFGLVQNGSTDDTAALTNLLTTIGTTNNADVLFTGPTALEPVVFTPNITVRMQQKGGFAPISTSTSPGGAGFVDHSADGSTPGSSNVNILTSSCSTTLKNTTAGNSIIFMETHFFTGAVIAVGTVTDTQGGFYRQLVQQGFNFSSVNSGWGHGNIAGGTVTITVQYLNNLGAPVNVANGCIAWEISGMGPVIGTDASATSPESGGAPSLVMSAGAINTTTGALVIGFGGQQYLNQSSCTPAAGFTQPAGSAGFISGGSQPSTGYGFNLCATYKLASPGGNQTPTSTITNDPINVPLNKYWAYAAVSVLPASSIITIQGPFDAPAKTVFTNSFAGQGTIDFTGNGSIDKVFPEWWGACGTCSASTNTSAIQAAVNAAYGTNRINGSQANQFNRELHFSTVYNVNGTITPLHMNGARWTCSQRFACGFVQTASNTSILTTTCAGTYWDLEDIGFSTNASQDLSHPLVDLNFTCTPGSDLVNQFIDMHRVTFNGNGIAAIGLRGSAAGGGAQYSNINHYNNLWQSFTEAGYMVGSGSGCGATTLATNAISINIFNGDFQGNHAYGFENFGGGQIHFDSTSFENGGFLPSAPQTGYDICGQAGAAGEGVILDDVRSESKALVGGNGPYTLRNSYNTDNAFVLGQGSLPTTGLEIQGSVTGGHGVYYTVTGGGTWTGIGTPNSTFFASSGSATTLANTNQIVTGSVTSPLPPLNSCQKGELMTQSVTGSTGTLLNGVTGNTAMQITAATGSPDSSHTWTGGTDSCVYTPTAAPVAASNLTVNAWVGFYLSLLNGAGQYQYCTITANTATTVTCSGGWQTDFPDYVTSANPDTTTQYIIEPAWGTQFSNNGVTWIADTTKITGLSSVYNAFIPGLQVLFSSQEPIVDRFQVTRADWYGGNGDSDNAQVWAFNGVVAGLTSSGTGAVVNTPPYRRYKNIRNGITEIPQAQPNTKGTSVDHWLSGLTGGGTATGDTYWGLNPNVGAGTKKGFQYLTNNSSGSAFTWQWNFDGSSSAPGPVTATDFEGTVGATTPTTGKFTAATSATYKTTTNCAAVGSAANPSLVACAAAAAGAFSCDVASSAATCVVSTTAVGANSRIIVQETSSENTSLGVTCNTSPTVIPAIPVPSKSPGVSFTINMPTITTNPACFDYWIVNQ
jgi:hypothetical protein